MKDLKDLQTVLASIERKEKTREKDLINIHEAEILNLKEQLNAEIKAYSKSLAKDFLLFKNKVKREREIKKNLDYKRSILRAKRAILDSLYNDFTDYLLSLDELSYSKLISKKLEDVNPEETSILYIGYKNIVPNVKGKVVFDNTIIFGFIYEAKHFKIDWTLKNILEDIKEKNEIEISKILFSEDEYEL